MKSFNFQDFDYKNLMYIFVFIVGMYFFYLYFLSRNKKTDSDKAKVIDYDGSSLTKDNTFFNSYASTLDSKFGNWYNSFTPSNLEVFETLLSLSVSDLKKLSNLFYSVYGKSLIRSIDDISFSPVWDGTETYIKKTQILEIMKNIPLPY